MFKLVLFNRQGRYSRKVGTITLTGGDFATWVPNLNGPYATPVQERAVENYCDRRMRADYTRALQQLTDAFDEVRIVKLDK